MPHLDSSLITILAISLFLLTGLVRAFKNGQIKIYQTKTGGLVTKTLDNSDEEIKVLNDLKPSIRQPHSLGNAEKFVTSFTKSTQIRWNVRRGTGALLLSPWKCIIAAIVCAAAGVALLYAADYGRKWALESVNWPTTQGRIIRSESWLDYHLNNHQYVKYSYTVNNEQYSSTELAFNSAHEQDTYGVAK